jgi:hypothetical protein
MGNRIGTQEGDCRELTPCVGVAWRMLVLRLIYALTHRLQPRSADLQFAVTPICNRLGTEQRLARRACARLAECNSAIQQIANLRYECGPTARWPSLLRKRRGRIGGSFLANRGSGGGASTSMLHARTPLPNPLPARPSRGEGAVLRSGGAVKRRPVWPERQDKRDSTTQDSKPPAWHKFPVQSLLRPA